MHETRVLEPDTLTLLRSLSERPELSHFIDFYFLLREFTVQEMLNFYRAKYADHDIFPVVRSLVYFDDAELDPESVMLELAPWETIKTAVTKEVRELG